jgi:sarcosine oxidase subunit beta
MFHPPGGIVRHDAVVWGLAKGSAKLGVHIHQGTEVTGIGVKNGKVAWVDTDRGRIHTSKVLNAAGAYSAGIAYKCLGQRLPISVLTIQAMVTQPLKPLLNHVVSSGAYHAYANQTLKGEIATGAHMDPWPNYTNQTTAHYIKHQAEAIGEMLPCLKGFASCAPGAVGRHDSGHGAHHGRKCPGGRLLPGLRLGLFRLQVIHRNRQIYGSICGHGQMP